MRINYLLPGLSGFLEKWKDCIFFFNVLGDLGFIDDEIGLTLVFISYSVVIFYLWAKKNLVKAKSLGFF